MKKFCSFVLAIVMTLSLCPGASAMENEAEASQNADNHVVFSNLSQLARGESIQYTAVEPDGTSAVVGIRRAPGYTRAGGQSWQVWYKGVNGSAEFYMDVSNNKVTAVYDYSISLLGGTYSDASLTKTSTYGKLTFNYKSLAGIVSGTCWLKGTVTGEDDQIEVTWQM